MFRKGVFAVLCVIIGSVLSGCATTGKQKDMEIQGLRNQVSALQVQIQSKDQELESLRSDLENSRLEKVQPSTIRKKAIGEVKSRPKARQIQVALANAGYYTGPIDGNIGKKTNEAIRAFQRANGLSVDGKVGKRTWELLRNYLYKKVK